MAKAIATLDAEAAQGWLKTSLIAAVAAMALAAVLILFPIWWVWAIIGVGVTVFVAMMMRNPLHRYMRLAGASLGAAIAAGIIPSFSATLVENPTRFAQVAIDNSPWAAVTLALVAVGFAVLDYLHRRPRGAADADAHQSTLKQTLGRDNQGTMQAAQQGGVAVAGSVGTLIVNPAAAPAPAPQLVPAIASGEGPSNLPPLSSNIVARKDITGKIHTALRKGQGPGAVRQAAAKAHGGYGKTVAALLYGHEYANEYPGGRFFLATENTDFTAQFASLGLLLGVPPEAKPAEAAPLVKGKLETGKPSLLILDNVADAAHWKSITDTGLLPGAPCHVLITTRAESIPKANLVPVGRLTKEEARAVYANFCRHADSGDGQEGRDVPDDATADAITSWLEGLAVAIAAVGARMKLRPDISWADYWERLKNLTIADLPDADEAVRAELGIGTKALEEHRKTMRVIDDAIDSLPPPERRAVAYASLLPADMVPVPWMKKLLADDAARADGPMRIEFRTKADDPNDPADTVLKHLETLDVLRAVGEDGNLLSMHRLWRQRINERATEAKYDRAGLWDAVAACVKSRFTVVVGMDEPGKANAIDNPHVVTEPDLRWELSPLAGVVATLWQAGRHGAAASIGTWVAVTLRRMGRFTEAAACLLPLPDHEAEVEAAIGPGEVANGYSNLAMIQKDQGDLPGARRSIERAIEINKKHLPDDHPAFAIRYSNLALIQQDQGDLVRARASIERAIEISKKHFPDDHPVFAIRYSNLALIQQDQGDLVRARASIERSIEISKKHFPADHITFATSYSNLAIIQQGQGDLVRAQASIEQAIEIGEKYLGKDHLLLATYSSNLGLIQRDKGDLRGARASLARAIEIDRKHFAEDHPTFATRYNNLACIELGEGNQTVACANFRKAIAIALKHFDENHPTVKTILKSMKDAGCGE